MNQKGFTPVLILVAIAAVIGVVAITYGYFIIKPASPASKQSPQITSVPLTQKDPIQPKVGTPECPELDYTGCDNSGNFMTWTDDGVR